MGQQISHFVCKVAFIPFFFYGSGQFFHQSDRLIHSFEQQYSRIRGHISAVESSHNIFVLDRAQMYFFLFLFLCLFLRYCNDYLGINGPDCNDLNPNTWDTCATCNDDDGEQQLHGSPPMGS